jgi:oligopeptide transport system permease protein
MMARKKGGIVDKVGNLYVLLINALPSAVYFLLIQLYLSTWLNLPMIVDRQGSLPSRILPIICLSLGGIASNAMWMRRYMVDQLNMDYIRLARAKGMTSTQVAFRHIFRNALVPMVQSLPASLLFTISGSLYVESLFSINGMGGLLVTSIQRQDNPLVQTMVLLYSVISVLGLLLGDLAMMLVDPRITFTKKGGSR